MKKILLSLMVCMTVNAYAFDEFCAGFEEGYKTIKGDMVMVPMCPMEPITPINSTPYREGIKKGIRAAEGD